MNKKIKIYYTSDTHGYIYPTNYQSRNEIPMGLLSIINEFEKDENTIILDGGDTIQGSPFTNYTYKDSTVSKVFNKAEYDFYTLGNHDFNYGYDILNHFINLMDSKCVIANIKDKTNKLDIKPYEIKTMGNGLKVGIVGIVTDYVKVWENPKNLDNIEILDAFSCAKNALEEIKEKCDISICIYHGGYEADLKTGIAYSRGKENVGYKICDELNFDLLLTAHQHRSVPLTDVSGTKTMQLSPNASQYAFIEIEVDGDEKIITGDLKAITKPPYKKLYNDLKPIQDKIEDYLDIKIGRFSEEIPVLSKEEIAVNGSRLADFINQVILEHTGADFACIGLANSDMGFKKDVSIRDVLVTFPYSNTMVVLEVTGEILKKALERSASYFDIKDDEIIISNRFLIPKKEHYNYDFFAGFSYVFDISKPLGERVVSIKKDGKDIKKEDVYTLAMSNYRATGTGGYTFYRDCKIVKEFGEDSQEILLNYIQNKKEVNISVKSDYMVLK